MQLQLWMLSFLIIKFIESYKVLDAYKESDTELILKFCLFCVVITECEWIYMKKVYYNQNYIQSSFIKTTWN